MFSSSFEVISGKFSAAKMLLPNNLVSCNRIKELFDF
jgi:hypothetical protein